MCIKTDAHVRQAVVNVVMDYQITVSEIKASHFRCDYKHSRSTLNILVYMKMEYDTLLLLLTTLHQNVLRSVKIYHLKSIVLF